MRTIHQADVEIVDDDRTIIRCECGYLALATVEHRDGADGDEELVPFRVDVLSPGEEQRVPLTFKDGRPFLGPDGEPVYRTVRPSHPALFGSSTVGDGGVCRLPQL
jgi:hypothetical protein